jgi:prepilin-type N-terminal cleavage/methylation domain-containing protein
MWLHFFKEESMRKKVTRHCEGAQSATAAIQKKSLDCFALRARNDVRGFTLAEVLITLGIIGVVAALVMPPLIQNSRKRAVETRLQKFYSVMQNAVKLSEVEHGDKEGWWTSDCGAMKCIDYFNEYLGKYIVTLEVKYVGNSVDSLNYIQATFNDGTMFIIKPSFDDIYFYPNKKKFNADGFGNTSGGDFSAVRPDAGINFFMFRFSPTSKSANNINHFNKGVDPYMLDLPENFTREMIINGSAQPSYGCKKNATVRAYCTALIRENGWKIPDDYPFKF